MKSQKGVTLMILVVTLIMMGLIAGTISYQSVSSYRLNAYYMMCSDIELLDEKIALYYLEKKELPTVSNETMPIRTLISDYKPQNVNYNPNNSGTLYEIDLDQLENLSLQKSKYYIDEQSHTIYSAQGIKMDQETYYTVPINYQEVNLAFYR